MNFLKRFQKRSKPSAEDEDEQQLQSLCTIVRSHGDAILSGKTKLSLTTPILIFLNGTFQKLTEGANQPCFQVANIADGTKRIQLISLLFEFMQKVVSLKLVSGPQSLDCPLLTVTHFKSLEVLEIRKFPIVYLKNLHCIRRHLKGLVCFRSTNSLEQVINSFGKDTEDLYSLPALTSLDLSYNTVEQINGDSLRLLPALEMLNVSFNCIKSADSTSLPPVSHLNLGFNSITEIPVLPAKLSHSLTHLILRNNNLATLSGLEALCCIELLDLACNCIRQFHDLDPLAYLDKLTSLSLVDNPISFYLNYFHFTIRKLSPAKRKGKIVLDGCVLEETELRYLGEDVQPMPLRSYIPVKPIGVPKEGSLLDLISSLPKLSSSSPPHESTPVRNGRIKAPVRDAAILDYACSPVITPNSYEVDIHIISPMSNRSSRSSLGNRKPSVDYDSYPIENTGPQDITDELICESESSTNDISDNIEGNIYSKQSALSLTTLEKEINKSPNDVVVISVVSSDDHKDNDNDSLNSVSSLLSDYDESEFTYLVQNVKRNKDEDVEDEEHLFLIFKPPYLLEKGEDGKLSNKLDLNYLRNVDIGLQKLTLIVTFDLVRSDWQYREYVFELEDQLNSFMDKVQPIAVKNYQKKISEMKHCECINCGNVFLMKEEYSESLYCTECGSTMVIDKNQTHIQATTNIDNNDNDNSTYPIGSSSTLLGQPNFDLFSSIELQKLINEPTSSDDVFMIGNEPCQVVSSWPLYKRRITRSIEVDKSSSLPALSSCRYEQKNIHSERITPSLYNKPVLTTKTKDNHSPITISSQHCDGKLQRYNSVSTNSSKKTGSIGTQSSVKNDNLVPSIDNYKKCDHRLKLFLSINVYNDEDEDFVCQLRCFCAQYNKPKEYDSLLNISTKNIYIFSVAECESDEPKDLFRKEASCSLHLLKFVLCGYYKQSFSLEFSKQGCYYTFVTQDSEKTNGFVNLLREQFKVMECFDENEPRFSCENNKQYITNIRKQVFHIPETVKDLGDRIYEQISSFSSPSFLKSQKVRLRTHHQCFVARELIDWLLAHREVKSRSEGVQLCADLFKIGYIFPVLNKECIFTDGEGVFKFSPFDDDEINELTRERAESESIDEMSTLVKLYSIAHVQRNETDSTFHLRSLITTETHIFLLNECHQWPLPRLHLPPPLLRDNFTIKDSRLITNVTSLEFFDDAPCYVNVCFDDEGSCTETKWLMRTESLEEMVKITNLIKTTWEALFAIELKVVLHISILPVLDNFEMVDE